MVFSSLIFVFAFLGIVLAIYYLIKPLPILYRNIWLFLASIFFYAWGEPKFFIVMLGSIAMNYIWGLVVDKYREASGAKWLLGVAVGSNLLILFLFKYLNFSVEILNSLLGVGLAVPGILLPIGISFFTFQAISYVLDVYYKRGKVQRNPLNVGLYIAFFPQLVAGPIVRYNTIAQQIQKRKETVSDFAYGVERFQIGFCKKILLSNTFAQVADLTFETAAAGANMGADLAWLGAVAYSLQILFDFSGYSDMAIGLGRMFGFRFDENFRYPYAAESVSDFWRRWHISLGTWFRDYVYIPLGGSRVGKPRMVLHLLIVWGLTGIWHGANWTFLVWGLFYFLLITFEKLTGLPRRFKTKGLRWFYRFVTLVAVAGGWVVFRSETMERAYRYVRIMFGLGDRGFHDTRLIFYVREYWIYWIVGILLCIPFAEMFKNRAEEAAVCPKVLQMLKPFLLTALFLIAITYLIVSNYNPFIYFNF